MNNDVRVYHDSPKQLIVVDVSLNDVAIAVDDLQFCILTVADAPDVDDDRWAAPDVVGELVGVLVGSEAGADRVFERHATARVWFKVTTDDQTVIGVCEWSVVFY